MIPSSRRRLGIALSAAVLVLFAVDWALFEVAGLGERLRLEDATLARSKILLASRYRDARVLHLGDSRTVTGLDPVVVSATCECGPGYNAAFSAADPVLTSIVADRVLHVLSPRAVVIGVSQWWLQDRTEQNFGAARDIVPPWELGRLIGVPEVRDVLSSTIAAAWRVYRYRSELRTTLGLARPLPSESVDHRRGYLARPYEMRTAEATVERDAAFLKTLWFTPYAVVGRRSAALLELLEHLHDRQIRVLLVGLPLHPAVRGRVPVELARFGDALVRLATKGHASVDDLSTDDSFAPHDFRDVVHLSVAGAEKLSRQVGARLRTVVTAADALQ